MTKIQSFLEDQLDVVRRAATGGFGDWRPRSIAWNRWEKVFRIEEKFIDCDNESVLIFWNPYTPIAHFLVPKKKDCQSMREMLFRSCSIMLMRDILRSGGDDEKVIEGFSSRVGYKQTKEFIKIYRSVNRRAEGGKTIYRG